ncbi:MAG: HlyC/CorC family transporter [Caldilineaceae bacterium]|nr:HlyC/CorC family transporter [Caldilineaceae bacterium]
MEPDPIPLSLLVLALAAIGFAVAAQTSLSNVSRSAMRKRSEEGESRAKIAEYLLRNPGSVEIATMLLKAAAVLVAGAAVVRLLPDTFSLGQLLVVAAIAWLLLVLSQTLVRSWVLARADAVALRLAHVLRMLVWLLTPVAALLQWAGGAVEPVSHAPVEEALRSMMGGEDDEPILESEKEMIASILEMDETVAREVMVPRLDVVAVAVETSLRDALSVIIDAGHSRIPVYDEHIDRIVGLLYAKDLLACFHADRGDVPIHTLLRPATFVPASKKVNTLLREMQRDHIHIAIVVDEYGGTAGLVTIEDILEEIVGDIQDEYDLEETYVQSIGPNAYLLNARFDVYSLSKLLDTELPNEDADTLGGMIYSLLGHVPRQGEFVEEGGWRFTVLTLEGRRIEQVRAERLNQDAGSDAEERSRAAAGPTANPELNYSASD